MPTLVPNFKATVYGFKVVFEDTSNIAADTFEWDFGDGTTSAERNPEHIYTAADTYTVSFKAILAAVEYPITKTFVVNEFPSIGYTILQMINSRIPTVTAADPVVQEQISALTKKHQLILQFSVSKEIDDANVFVEASWPPLVNLLISCLVVIDLVQISTTKGLQSNADSNSTSSGSGGGGLKRVTTGPTEVEYHESSKLLQSVYSKRGKDSTSPFDELRAEACLIAGRLGIHLPFCAYLPKGVRPIKMTTHEL